jgi:predicted nuclease of predicted toxin-antitoxin system
VRWLADENIHNAIVGELRRAGHDVSYAAETAQQASDRQLTDLALAEGRILLTEDKDFGEIVFLERRQTGGVVLLRLGTQHWSAKWTRLLAVIALHGEILLRQYTVVDDGGVRVQPLPPE